MIELIMEKMLKETCVAEFEKLSKRFARQPEERHCTAGRITAGSRA